MVSVIVAFVILELVPRELSSNPAAEASHLSYFPSSRHSSMLETTPFPKIPEGYNKVVTLEA